jgi:molybdenum cofactor biosynthesis enzyme MoaA
MLKIVCKDKNNIYMTTNQMIDIIINPKHIQMVYTKDANEAEVINVFISIDGFSQLMTFKCLKSSVDQVLEAIQHAVEDKLGSVQLNIDYKGNASYNYI